MTIEEIKERQTSVRLIGERLYFADQSDSVQTLGSGVCFWLAEIALQMAKQNQQLEQLNRYQQQLSNCIIGDDHIRIAKV